MSQLVPNFLIDDAGPGPLRHAGLVLALAHGAGAPMDSPFLTEFSRAIAAHGVRVARFEFPYMAARRIDGKKRGPDRQPALLETWAAAIDGLGPARRLVIGGKSLGGRMATLAAAAAEQAGAPVAGVVCLGYPFHPPGRPEKTRVEHLKGLATPTLIVQGTRDRLGTCADVGGYDLSPALRLLWLEDGDHDLTPRKKSGRTQAQNWGEAVAGITEFLETLN
jgi:hypothetical protein